MSDVLRARLHTAAYQRCAEDTGANLCFQTLTLVLTLSGETSVFMPIFTARHLVSTRDMIAKEAVIAQTAHLFKLMCFVICVFDFKCTARHPPPLSHEVFHDRKGGSREHICCYL